MAMWINYSATKTKQRHHPSLRGKIRFGTKKDLQCVITDNTDAQHVPVVDAVFLDGAAVVFMLNPGTANMQDYPDCVCTIRQI